MNSTLDDLLDRCVLVYLDDILVYSRDEAEHKRHLRTMFQRLQQCKLYAKRTKCKFGVPEIEYPGHLVAAG